MISSLNYTIIRSPRKTISLYVLADGTLEVRAPRFTPDFFIKKFVESKQEWIQKRRKQLATVPVKRDTLLFLGEEYTVQSSDVLQITLKEKTLLFPRSLEFRLQKELQAWFIQQAKEIITKRVMMNAKDMNLTYKKIYFSDTSSKWGSCSHDNVLQFNWRLVMAPLMVLNYVVIHELAHVQEKNHSQAFWLLVERYNPSYRQQRLWLKRNGALLHSSL